MILQRIQAMFLKPKTKCTESPARRLKLESLEGRDVPAIFTVTSNLDYTIDDGR